MGKISFIKWYEGVLGAIVFLMIVAPRLIGVGVILLLSVWVVGLVKKKMVFKFNALNLFFFLLYLSYLIGTTYTNNSDIAFKYLEYKLTFLLFPLVFSFKPKEFLSLRVPATSLILGVLVVSVLGLMNSMPLYIEEKDFNFLMSANFSYIHHPTYLSVYAAFGSFLLVLGRKKNWLYYSTSTVVILFVVLVFVQVLCFSLAGFLFLLAFLSILALIWVKNAFSKSIFYGFLIVGMISLFGVIKFTPGVNTQFQYSIDYLVEYWENPKEFFRSKQTYVGGSETRLIMWAASAQVFAEHPLGVGTGNVDDYLTDKLNEIGQPHMAEKKYNPHNQFLQTGVEVGAVGLSLLLLILFYGVYYSIKTKNWLLLFIIISLAFNCLFESMLQRQSGIVFYTFWICILIVSKNYTQKIE